MAITRGLSVAQQTWVRDVLSRNRGQLVHSDLDANEKLAALLTSSRDLLNAIKTSADSTAAYPRLQQLEHVAEEVVRISVETDAEIPDLLRRIARDFDRGDEDQEFGRLYDDIRSGVYVPE